jgi:putative transposase
MVAVVSWISVTDGYPPQNHRWKRWKYLGENFYMKKSKFSDSQIMQAIKRVEAGLPVPDLCRDIGISTATFCRTACTHNGLIRLAAKRQKPTQHKSLPGSKHQRHHAAQALWPGTRAPRSLAKPAGRGAKPRCMQRQDEHWCRHGLSNRVQLATFASARAWKIAGAEPHYRLTSPPPAQLPLASEDRVLHLHLTD